MTGDGLAAAALADLIDRLAADDPAPGAGPAAAWACAMAAALVEMVTAVELRREPADPATVRARGERAASLRARALALADLDVAAYTGVLDVLARRDEPGHGGRLREALAEAAGPPLEIARAAGEATRLAAEAAAVARGGVRGEAVAAAVLGEAAVRAAVPLVEINLAGHPRGSAPRRGRRARARRRIRSRSRADAAGQEGAGAAADPADRAVRARAPRRARADGVRGRRPDRRRGVARRRARTHRRRLRGRRLDRRAVRRGGRRRASAAA